VRPVRPGPRPVKDVLVAVPFGGRLDPRGVQPGVGFSQSERDEVAIDDAGQPPLLLFFRAQFGNRDASEERTGAGFTVDCEAYDERR
jgi:hypothetical protein